MSTPDRSHHLDAGIPQEWGPGPWDDESRGWAAAYRSGDLRSWADGDPLEGVRLPIRITGGRALGPLTAPRRSL